MPFFRNWGLRCVLDTPDTSDAIAVMIRSMVETDLDEVVDTHLRAFPGFFLTFLGKDFLSLLYKSMANDGEGVMLVAVSDSHVIGFVAGVTRQEGFYRRLIATRKWAFGRAALIALLRRPLIAPRLLRALSRPTESRVAAAEACLMSIAVRPEEAGKGVGRQLVQAFCENMAQRGASRVCLTTDRDNNERANRFYQAIGFRIHRTITTPEGRVLNEYVTDFA
jgi:ribosomal protein S18 acetylase RimI-like enzyme